MQPKKINLEGPWEVVGPDMFSLCNKNYLCTVDEKGKFPVIKMTGGL